MQVGRLEWGLRHGWENMDNIIVDEHTGMRKWSNKALAAATAAAEREGEREKERPRDSVA